MTYSSSKIIRSKELVAHLGIGRSTLYDWINPKSSRFDPTFPKKIKMGKACVGWLEEDIKIWLNNLK